MNEIYKLPKLNYNYNELEPYISREQLKIHYEKHHKSYVEKTNAILKEIRKNRKENLSFDIKSILKNLSFNLGGHILHSLFWENLTPARKSFKKPNKTLYNFIKENFENLEKFKKEFSETALSVEGSGWAALSFCKETKKLIIMQIEKHNANIYPNLEIIMVLDVFEHAYYIDYKNQRAKFIECFWKIINWNIIEKRLVKALVKVV